MKGVIFRKLNTKKDYKVIYKHSSFKDVWRCYPLHMEPPYDYQHIKLFATDFIEECLKEKQNDTNNLH